MQDEGGARFYDRIQAGYELAEDLKRFLHGEKPYVLAIPPEGVHVAATLASELGAPLDVIISRRIVAPSHEDETLGAVTPDRTLVVNKPLVAELGLSDEEIEQLSIPVWATVQRLHERYRNGRPYPDLNDATAIIVGDGLTSGYTMMAAVVAVRKLHPARMVVAVPVAALDAVERLSAHVDDLLSLVISRETPFSVEDFYVNYPEVSEQEVIWTLEHFSKEQPEGYAELY